MSPLIILGLSITLLVLLSICIILLFSWRNKNALHQHLAHLLEDINEQQNSRKTQLAKRLGNTLKLSKNESDRLSEQLVEAEKKFLQQYVGQVIRQMPDNHLYTELTELLDGHIHTLSNYLQSQETKPIELPNPEDTPEEISAEPGTSEESTSSQKPEPEPDWGDVFD